MYLHEVMPAQMDTALPHREAPVEAVQPQPSPFDILRGQRAVLLGMVAALVCRGAMVAPAIAQESSDGTHCVTTQTIEATTTICDDGSDEQTPDTPETSSDTPDDNDTHSKPKKPKRPKTPELSVRQRYAQEVIDMVHDGRIIIQPLRGGKNARDHAAYATPMDNLKSARAGRPSLGSTRCEFPRSKAYLNPKILRFLAGVGTRIPVRITALVGGCHEDNSRHRAGDAVDIGCPISPKQESIMQRIGRKVGIRRYMGESCDPRKGFHEHWSTKGN